MTPVRVGQHRQDARGSYKVVAQSCGWFAILYDDGSGGPWETESKIEKDSLVIDGGNRTRVTAGPEWMVHDIGGRHG